MGADDEAESLELQPIDYVASLAKALLGEVPFAGSLLVELAGAVIPNQRMERIVEYTKALERRLARLEQGFVRSQLTNESFTDLMEEGLRQAARSLTDERRDYIASLVASSLSSADIAYEESKRLLRILGEINDVEVIWLRFFLKPATSEDQPFREKHKAILTRVAAHIGAPQEVLDGATLQSSYKEHLTQLGLLERRYQTDVHSKQPVFDSSTGGMKVRGYRLTTLGRLLLREIGLTEEAGAG